MKAVEKLREISEKLTLCGIEAAEKEAELFIRQGLKIDPVQLYRDNSEIDDEQSAAVEEMFARRVKREPLQYILGFSDFLGLKIQVGKGVLIPRPETELMAEYAIDMQRAKNEEQRAKSKEQRAKTTDNGQRTTFLDLCTGSGCLALALASAFPDSQVTGIDISETAVDYARKNAGLNGIENVRFLNGHLFEPLDEDQLFDLIISNPPYIRTDDIKALQPEIRDWEPLNALDGGEDGLEFYREIIPASRQYLKDNGIIMLELGDGCEDAVAGMLDRAGYNEVKVRKDYAGVERIINARWIR
jgi:release factor glutamine methyltransferase